MKKIFLSFYLTICLLFTGCEKSDPFLKDTDYWTVEDLTGVWVKEEDVDNPKAYFVEFYSNWTYHSIGLLQYGAQLYDSGNYSVSGTNGRILYLRGYGGWDLYVDWLNKEHTKMKWRGLKYQSQEPDNDWSWTLVKVSGIPSEYKK